MAQNPGDKAPRGRALRYEDSGTTGLNVNKKESVSFDARELQQALTKQNIVFLKRFLFAAFHLSLTTHPGSSSTEEARRVEMPRQSQLRLPAAQVLKA